MQSFLKESLDALAQQSTPISEVTIILPSKRAGGFLRQILVENTDENFFAPTILSIEEFVCDIAGMHQLPKTELLVQGYQVFKQFKDESFSSYLSWIEPLLNDFSEIDRHLVPQKEFFDYFIGIKKMEKWGAQETPMIKEYLAFWESVHLFYDALTDTLLKQQKGYQGMIYRKATEELEFYLERSQNIQHVFLGFNALNKAEQIIIQELLEQGNTQVFWDMDHYFAKDNDHSVSHFYRKYMKEWKYYQGGKQPLLASNYEKDKTIDIIATQSDIEQVKYVGNLLRRYSNEQLDQTAIILADESLLIPLLYSLPENLKQVNITMGYPLRSLPTAQFFLQWLDFACVTTSGIYYKSLQKLLSHPIGEHLIPNAESILTSLAEQNKTHSSVSYLIEVASADQQKGLQLLFDLPKDPSSLLKRALHLVALLLKDKKLSQIDTLVAFKIQDVLHEIEALQEANPILTSKEALKDIFEIMLYNESLDMEGDAYQGLQIMGMLETRVLDFKNIIVLSVNEGTLPTGKSQASFLTYDLKSTFNLPLHTEKDAIYAYHFYRLLQRCPNITLLYNAASSGLVSGEKSRFLRQLEMDKLPKHQLHFKSLQQEVRVPDKKPQTIVKSEGIMTRLREIARKGFSPSALTAYIRNPIDFYQQRILGIREVEEVEETVAYNTLGTIVHESLEILYKPYIGENLTIEKLTACLPKVPKTVTAMFDKHFLLGDYTTGKNLIVYEVAVRYVENLIQWDLKNLRQGNTIQLIALEKEIELPISGLTLDFPVQLKGTVDRIDRINGNLRIIDYKTGRVEARKLALNDWDILLEDYEYSKAFQVLMYAYMQYQLDPYNTAMAGIVSFKSMKSGFMNFTDKSTKKEMVDANILHHFESYLFRLIQEICDPDMAFIEKEIPEKTW